MKNNTILQHKIDRLHHMAASIEETMTQEEFKKAYPQGECEYFTKAEIDKYFSDVKVLLEKSQSPKEFENVFEKAKKNLSKLQKKIVTTKTGNKMTVYVKSAEAKTKKEATSEFNPNGLMQKWPKLSDAEKQGALFSILEEKAEGRLSHINKVLFDRELAKHPHLKQQVEAKQKKGAGKTKSIKKEQAKKVETEKEESKKVVKESGVSKKTDKKLSKSEKIALLKGESFTKMTDLSTLSKSEKIDLFKSKKKS